ncbi:MAG: hypothetical protein OXC46_02790, partial [Thaumarchaeota archaeon]|nr:hypothetical protein [Nitrososphaerota archaeon]
MIVLLSNKWDISTDYIVQSLQKRNCDYLRLNTEDIANSSNTIFFPDFTYWVNNNKNNLTETLQSVLLRRPGKPFEFSNVDKPDPSALQYITEQWHSFISGLESISDVLWINSRNKNNFAEVKINQLKLAEEMKFKIPKTCITNSKADLMRFTESCTNGIVAKALYSPLI